MLKTHLSIQVTGRVQGVGYRAGALHKARQLGLTGWIQNNADGSVLIEVEGPQEQVDEFVRWCWRGPMLAKVEKVTTSIGTVQHFDQFSIRKN